MTTREHKPALVGLWLAASIAFALLDEGFVACLAFGIAILLTALSPGKGLS